MSKSREHNHDGPSRRQPSGPKSHRNRNPGFNRRKFPDRWLNYDPVGKDIPGTRIIAFKTPLSPAFFVGMEEDDQDRFEVETLLRYAANAGKSMGLVVDLTNTDRYYDSSVWIQNGVLYEKIRCPGHEVHGHEHLVDRFMTVLKEFFRDNSNNGMQYSQRRQKINGV
jgi:atypical dual specificity phosphatase